MKIEITTISKKIYLVQDYRIATLRTVIFKDGFGTEYFIPLENIESIKIEKD